jgi:CheY-like chemotaxis protein
VEGQSKDMQNKQLNESTCVLEREDIVSIAVSDSPYVLVIDDDDSILSVVLLLLEMEEHIGLGVVDSTKVVPLLEGLDSKHFPSVILLDLMMPMVTGYEIAAHLSQHPRYGHIPIVVMTADNRVRSASAVPGAVDWISKPFEMEDLLAKLERYLLSSSTS